MVLVLLAALAGGYLARWAQEEPAAYLPVDGMPSLDFFITRQSFSEVEKAMDHLETLRAQYQTRIRARQLKAATAPKPPAVTAKTSLLLAISDLEKGVVEFGGSGQELVLVGDLLRDLKSAELLDRWIEVYLKVAYDHRTATLVSDFAEDAVLISKARGREHDVLQALRHVNAIPLDFEGKHRISTVLLQLRTQVPWEEDHNPGEIMSPPWNLPNADPR